jgi:hypothetical protein
MKKEKLYVLMHGTDGMALNETNDPRAHNDFLGYLSSCWDHGVGIMLWATLIRMKDGAVIAEWRRRASPQ